MSEHFTEASPDENIEIIEDYIIEEIEDDKDIFSDGEEYAHIVCLEKDESTGENIYHCALCNVTFASIEDHLRESHNRSTVEYYNQNMHIVVKEEEEQDEMYMSRQLSLQDSKEIKSATDSIKIETSDIACQNCDCVFETMHEAEAHQCLGINTDLALMCNACETIFEVEEDIRSHLCPAISVKEEPITSLFSCPDCPKKFTVINMLQQHQKVHKTKKPQVRKLKKGIKEEVTDNISEEKRHCDICNTTFSSSKNLKLHAKMHLTIPMKTIKDAMPIGTDDANDKNQFYCEICNKSFDHALLAVHQNMHQNIEEHNCSICNRQFENQISYDMHMQLHSDQPTRVRAQKVAKPGARFACNYCGREFLRPHEKVKHERIHTGEKPHECEVCGKSFRVSYSLTLHLRTHTDVRPFVCAQCNKRFKAYAVYSHHLNTHSEDRPYKCPMCPKSFRTSVQLCGHKNSHTKPYTCPECNRPFASLYAVKMHMKTHNKANKSNENLKHRCGICGAVYARMFALRFHMKEQHSADVTEDQENDHDDNKQPPITADDCFNEDEVSTQAIMQGEEIIIDNFHTEEIVTDWLTSK